MSEVHKVPTGVPGFDIISHGGIPQSRSTLVSGRSGTGKTILGLQIAANVARSGTPALVLAVEESPQDLVTCGDSLGFDLSGLVAQGALRVADITRPMDGPTLVSGEYDVSGLIHRIESVARESGARLVVLDSATALFSPRPPQEQLRSLFFQLVHAFRRLDLTSVILAEAGRDEFSTSLGVEDYVCDVVVIFRNVADGERRRRTVEINKYRRSAHYKGEYPCTITSRGLAIFPLDAREHAHTRDLTRYPSGLPGLDAMIGGGLIRDSIVIVRGPTGSGKTLLAGLYARAGASRSERVAYYGFEEPRAVLLRNFAQLGMPLEELEAEGTLTLVCRYPESMGFEDLLVQLRGSLEEFQPSLIVLDSISSIEHSLSEKGFRQFMVGLTSIIREHSRSALLTQAVAQGGAAEQTAPYLSTIADAIVALDYDLDPGGLKRTMRVLKMRGSQHDTVPYRLRIGQGGPKVEKEALRGQNEGGGAGGVAATFPRGLPGALAAATPPRQLLKGARVLLVEDFDEARECIRYVLEQRGAEVVTATSSEEALDVAGRALPNALVCDIGLPGEDGYALLRRLRAVSPQHAAIPALALTAWTLPEDRQRAREAGYAMHLAKPVEPDELATALAGLLEH
jgi:circadian clock protein KaiC